MKSSTYSALLLLVVLCSLLSFAAAASLASGEASDSHSGFDMDGISEILPNALKQAKSSCDDDLDCLGSNAYCQRETCKYCDSQMHWNGYYCVKDNCKDGELWDREEKECRELTDGEKLAVGVIVALAVGIPLLIVISICCCCCCCAGCAGHAYRQRRNNRS